MLNFFKNSFQHFKSRLLMGIVILVPMGITFLFLELILKLAYQFSKNLIPKAFFAGDIHEYIIMIFALFILILLVYCIGWMGSHYTGKKIIGFWENFLLKIPVVKSVYHASKDIVKAFSFNTNEGFKSVVIVEFPLPGRFALGFLTGTIINSSHQVFYKVYVPTSPNPTSGYFIFYPEHAVKPAEMSVETALQTIISGGIVGPDTIDL